MKSATSLMPLNTGLSRIQFSILNVLESLIPTDQQNYIQGTINFDYLLHVLYTMYLQHLRHLGLDLSLWWIIAPANMKIIHFKVLFTIYHQKKNVNKGNN